MTGAEKAVHTVQPKGVERPIGNREKGGATSFPRQD